MLLFFLFRFTRSEYEDIGSVVGDIGKILTSTGSFFHWQDGDAVGDMEFPFKPGEFQNVQWLDSYFLAFVSCGFLLGLVCAVFMFITTILGYVSQYCFNEPRDGKSKLICCISLCGQILVVLFLLLSGVYVLIGGLLRPDVSSKGTNNPYTSLSSALSQFYTDVYTNIIAQTNNCGTV